MKRWIYEPPCPEKVKALRAVLGLRESICNILVKRCIHTFEEARNFFRPNHKHFHDPFLMKDMQKAVERVIAAIQGRQKLLIIGDYDVDGTTATAILVDFLQQRHASVHYYIPDRYNEGYGVSDKAIAFARQNDYQLIISLDCGIKANRQIAAAHHLGIDFIVCDHHLPGELLPRAFAILNPRQPDCGYPYKYLSGCGVAFKLITALAIRMNIEVSTLYCYLDLVMVSIAADIVPLTGENRALASMGLKHFNNTPCAGLKALIDLQPKSDNYTLRDVVFGIAPAINAAGRMKDARLAVELFMESKPKRATILAKQLWDLNVERKEADAAITQEAHEIINGNAEMLQRKTTLVFKEGWHKGVVGIVASRLIERYHRPTIVFSIQGSVATGSARSVPGFNITRAINSCAEYLITFGGHEAAAGLSLPTSNMPVFSQKFEEVVAQSIEEKHLIPEIHIDTEISFAQISIRFLDIIKQMEPFGPQNTNPVFLTKKIRNTKWSRILKEKHLRIVVENEGVTLSGIAFGMADKLQILTENEFSDLVFHLEENEWNGNKSIQLKVIDIRPHKD